MKSRAFDAFGASADDGEFGAAPDVPGQVQSRRAPRSDPAGLARAELDVWLQEVEKPPAWVELWEELCAERAPVMGADGELALNERGEARVRRRWNWRQALFIAWSATPRSQRVPKTRKEVADLLGVSSPATFRNWRRADKGLDERVRAVPRELLIGHLADVYEALATVASSVDPRGHPDRKLYLELVGEYTPRSELKQDLTLQGPVALLPDADLDESDGDE